MTLDSHPSKRFVFSLIVGFVSALCAGGAYAQQNLPDSDSVEIHELRENGTIRLVAKNSLYGPVQVGLYLSNVDQLVSDDTDLLRVLPAQSETDIVRLDAATVAASGGLEYEFLHIPGEPGARHAPASPYRLPYAVAARHTVTQAYPEKITHTDPSSAHAIDFAMPIGTGVNAARAGTVMQVTSDYFGSTTADGEQRANLVRILHDDGTMAVYAHLHWDSIRVRPGDRVARGELIAASGNTGYSTGPHLHFVVQRNRGGSIVSVPVQFAGLGGQPVIIESGDEPVAY
ncbi:MAG: peptidoglycan DD-metalloendopeptidase family protein [Gammaproteobacteria bacterium]|nr:peptidoglycan DD-metalloendopeptidase family protein [Gammaproteobacteria bacterium]